MRGTQTKFSDEWVVLDQMQQTKKATLRLQKENGRYRVTTANGQLISKEVRLTNCWRNNMHDWRVSVRFRFEGSVWWGVGDAEGKNLRCRRTRLKGLYAK